MVKDRLYDHPEVTREVLRLVIKGNTTREELAEELGCAPKTVYNKVHDPKVLGFLEREDGEYVISDKSELMKLFQLDKREVLKKRFEDLPGVEEVNDELVGGSLSFVRVGRIISYYTNSEAIDEDAFETYGRIYSKWFEFLGMGYAFDQTLSREKPANYEQEKSITHSGEGYPTVRPRKAFEGLGVIRNGNHSRAEIINNSNFSESEADKVLTSLYSLGFARRTSDGVFVTDEGVNVLEANEDERKALVRDSLLDLTLIKEYCELAPDTPFKNQEIMSKVGESLDRNWSETTRETKGKRLYQWLLYSGLFKEVKRGTLVSTAVTGDEGLTSIDDYV